MAKPNLAGSVPAADQAARPVSSARWALAGLALSVLLSSLGTSIANVGLLNLSRNLGLVTGASVMGAVFARAAATADIMTASPAAVAGGMRTTFAVAAILIGVALVIGRSSVRAGDALPGK